MEAGRLYVAGMAVCPGLLTETLRLIFLAIAFLLKNNFYWPGQRVC
jgi:hypothetical protein